MSCTVLILQKSDPARMLEWKGTDGVPEVATVKVGAAVSALVTVDTTQTVLAANPLRNKMILQNLSAQPIYVLFGPGASATAFSLVLQAGAITKDGKGGVLIDDCYTGIVTAVAATGTAIQLVATEY